jgi:hypothetical protein
LVDVMAAAGRSPMANQHGDVVWGAFQPRERLEEALRPGYHTDLNVMLLVRQENSGPAPVNSSTFAALCQSWRDATFPRKGPDGTRIGEALDRWRSGARDGDMGFGDLPAGDRVIVAAEHPEPDVCQLLTVGRSPSSEGGITDVWCETRILVNGQILCFYWSRAATTVGDLAEVTERSSRWAHAVHVANP